MLIALAILLTVVLLFTPSGEARRR